MTVYFTASVVGKKHYRENYKRIIDYLASKGHTVISDHITKVTPEQVDTASKKDRIAFHDKLERWITTSDFMIVEATFPSMSVGYEVSLAMNRGKPVLILYCQGEPPALFAYHENELIVCEKYEESTLSGIIDDFIGYIRGTNDSRFTFYITSEIALYLDKVSKKSKIPKAVYLRQLIEKDMHQS